MRRRTKYVIGGAVVGIVVVIFLVVVMKEGNGTGGDGGFNEKAEKGFVIKGDSAEDNVEALVQRVDVLIHQTQEKRNKLKELDKELDELNELAKAVSQSNHEKIQQIKELQQEEEQKEQQKKQDQHKGASTSGSGIVSPVIVMACNRPSVSRALDLLVKYRPSVEKFPIIVSQDCGDAKTAAVIAEYKDKGVRHIKQPDLSEPVVSPSMSQFKGYAKIARHYGWMFKQVFESMKYDSVIIVEDDLDVAPDFFEYFEAGKKLLEVDDTLWCVSAWNDNGKKGFVQDPKKLYRSDFFGGLGWMIQRKLWVEELGSKWPSNFWDDWMREHEQRQGRACIRPEISRTSTFGRVGVSRGQFFDQYLKYIQLAETKIDFTKEDLSYLIKDNYDLDFLQEVYSAPVVSSFGAMNTHAPIVRIEYTSPPHYLKIAREFGIMDDIKDNIPRTAYFGVVSFYKNGVKIHLAPQRPWKGYE
eukprot:m.45060 g.45060  ORF g.45060 m.45060 type:complete len:470 (-) comp7201_c0_seq1:129-1538(-)